MREGSAKAASASAGNDSDAGSSDTGPCGPLGYPHTHGNRLRTV